MSLQPMPVIPVDVEVELVAWLKTWLEGRPESYAAGVYLGSEKPQNNRDRIVVVTRDGGEIRGVVDKPRVRVRVWSSNRDEANDLALLLVAGIKAAPGHGALLAVTQVFGPSPVADASQPQYLINAELRTRCTAA